MKLCNKIVAYDVESTSEQYFRALLLERETKLKKKIFSPCLSYLYRSRLQNVHVGIINIITTSLGLADVLMPWKLHLISPGSGLCFEPIILLSTLEVNFFREIIDQNLSFHKNLRGRQVQTT